MLSQSGSEIGGDAAIVYLVVQLANEYVNIIEAILEISECCQYRCHEMASIRQREGTKFWITDGHRDDGKRFIVRADEKLSAFLELERAVSIHVLSEQV